MQPQPNRIEQPNLRPQVASSLSALCENIVRGVAAVLSTHQDASEAQINALEKGLRDAQAEASEQHAIQMKAIKQVAGRLERLETSLLGDNVGGGKSVIERLDVIEVEVRPPERVMLSVAVSPAGTRPPSPRWFTTDRTRPHRRTRTPNSVADPQALSPIHKSSDIGARQTPDHSEHESPNSPERMTAFGHPLHESPSDLGQRGMEMRTAIPVQSYFSSPPPSSFSHSLKSVDWTSLTADRAASNLTAGGPGSSVGLLPPLESYMLLPPRALSPDGTITSLRHSTFGDALAPAEVLFPVPPSSHPPSPIMNIQLSTLPDSETTMQVDIQEPAEVEPSEYGDSDAEVEEALHIPATDTPTADPLPLDAENYLAIQPSSSFSDRFRSLSPLSSLSSTDVDTEDLSDRKDLVVSPPRKRRRIALRTLYSGADSGSRRRKRKSGVSVKPETQRLPTRKLGSVGTSKWDNVLECDWPARTDDPGEFQRSSIQCDKCDVWYHYGCVGIAFGDLLIGPNSSELFVCPPCNSAANTGARRRSQRISAFQCARPDCFHLEVEAAEEYVVEKLIGRTGRRDEGEKDGRKGFMWLIKWDGYPVTQATWTPEEDIGYVAKLEEAFNVAAELEGLDLEAYFEVLLLKEAAEGGWVAGY